MAEINVDSLEWEDRNINHIARHNVTPIEVAEVCLDPQSKKRDVHSGRFMLIGRSGTRILSVILSSLNANGKYYVVTARDSDKRERKTYRGE